MSTVGIELCDAGFRAASLEGTQPRVLEVDDGQGSSEWPAFACFDGDKYVCGRSAEDQWLVHPRRVSHTFWARLGHEPSALGPANGPARCSELAFYLCREFFARLSSLRTSERLMLAIPGAFLADLATEEEKVGLLLGISHELKLPLAGMVDMACAALCDPRGPGINPARPTVVIDLNLEGTDLTLLSCDDLLRRQDFVQLPDAGYAQALRHLTASMGNRFLRHTSFDILEDGRIEQSFFRQTKDFLASGSMEHRYQINTRSRTYEMAAKREQLAGDLHAFTAQLSQGLKGFLQKSAHSAASCTLALSHRTAILPSLEDSLNAAGFNHVIRLPAGAAACGAALIGAKSASRARDLSDVPVATSVPSDLACRIPPRRWETRVHRLNRPKGGTLVPTHVVLDGVGHSLATPRKYVISAAGSEVDIGLPEAFGSAGDLRLHLLHEGEVLWLLEQRGNDSEARTAIGAGDRLLVRCGPATAELHFAHCHSASAPGRRS